MKPARSADHVIHATLEGDQVVFTPAWLARRLDAIHGANTWARLRKAIGDAEYRTIVSRYLDCQDTDDPVEPRPRQHLVLAEIPGYSDGDWPEYPRQVMLDWLPPDIIERFGTIEPTMLNGNTLHLPASAADAIARALAGHGYDVRGLEPEPQPGPQPAARRPRQARPAGKPRRPATKKH
jgi:hypothetical protein